MLINVILSDINNSYQVIRNLELFKNRLSCEIIFKNDFTEGQMLCIIAYLRTWAKRNRIWFEDAIWVSHHGTEASYSIFRHWLVPRIHCSRMVTQIGKG